MLKRSITLLYSTILSLAMAGCSDSDGGSSDTPSSASASVEAISFEADGGTQHFTVSTSGEWDAVCSESWISLVKSGTLTTSGSVEVSAAANASRTARSATVTVMAGTARAKVEISQAGKAPEPVDPTIKVPDGYELVWHDEFDGNSLNTSDWRHEVQGPGWVNNELQTYVNGAYDGIPVTEVADGKLSIHCFKHAGRVYSGRIYAQESTGWTYGIFEARIKLPKGKGTWPAFWMMPSKNDFNANPWPRCGEIDIMEEVGYNPNYTSSSIHCESYNHVLGTQRTAERLTQGAQDDFHVYRLEWTPDYIRTYVDDVRLLSFANDGSGKVATWPFNKPFYLILNLAWGGDWGGAQGVDESCLPATMEVDYVRVFQQK
ncbi:MAG: family 16 glycosylhydrolase [Muribaculaceae bacterium]|nr:family 16 glycosylhydrolase [Muribaculaceae bacterium]